MHFSAWQLSPRPQSGKSLNVSRLVYTHRCQKRQKKKKGISFVCVLFDFGKKAGDNGIVGNARPPERRRAAVISVEAIRKDIIMRNSWGLKHLRGSFRFSGKNPKFFSIDFLLVLVCVLEHKRAKMCVTALLSSDEKLRSRQ